MAEPSAPKPEKDPATGRFLPGNNGGPGRPEGARVKLEAKFLDDIYGDWKDNGKVVIAQVRAEKPDVYLRVVASILPEQKNVTVNVFDQMTEDELIQRLHQLDAIIGPLIAAAGEGEDRDGTGTETLN